MPHNFSDVQQDRQSFTNLANQLVGEAGSNQVIRVRAQPQGEGMRFHVEASAEPGQGEAERAVALLKESIDRQLGPGKGQEVFQRAGLADAQAVRGTDLAALKAEYQNVKQEVRQELSNVNRPSVVQWRDAAANNVPLQPKAADDTLEALANDPAVNWSVASSGANAALIATKPDGTGVVIKIEDEAAANQAVHASEMLQGAFGGDNGAFEVAPVTDESQNAVGKAALKTRLQQLAAQTEDPIKRRKIAENIEKLDQVGPGNKGITKMGFVSGVQVNKLSLDEKVAVIQSGALAREVGKAAVLCPQAQLSDHACANNDTRMATTNLSNFMIDRDTGKMAPIDFDLKHGTRGVAEGVEQLTDLVQRATQSPEGYNAVVQQLMADANGANRSCVRESMEGMLSPGGNVEGLFDAYEKDAVDGIVNSPEVCRRQAEALLNGLIDGFEYCQQNQVRMAEALGPPDGLSPEDMERINAAVDGVNVAQMRQNLAQYSAQPLQVQQAQAQGQQQGRNGLMNRAGNSIRSVIDSLKSAKNEVKSALGLDLQGKLDRAQKALDKRQTHLDNLTARRDALQARLEDSNIQRLLNERPDPSKFLAGGQGDIRHQQNVMDARELQRQFAKLDQRVQRNEQKVGELGRKRDNLHQRVQLRQHAQQAPAQRGPGVGV